MSLRTAATKARENVKAILFVFADCNENVNVKCSYVTRTKYVSHSVGQAQYLVRLDRDTCCFAHCK